MKYKNHFPSLIFLTGMPSSGKSTLGKDLASKTDYNFYDLDQFIEEKERKNIPDIFEEEGEKKFRQIETNTLKEITKHQKLVVSTGGGTPCFNDNLKIMKESGITIFIDVSEKALKKRLLAHKNNINNRPLIKGKPVDEYINDTLNKRRSFYEQAHLTIKGDQIKPEDILNKIHEYYNNLKLN